MERTCACCGRTFLPHPALAKTIVQRYCSDPACQRARKRRWQKAKLASDNDYRETQADAQRRWCGRNRDYWRQYRQRNPEYAERNRQRQRERNRRRRLGAGIAKMDALQAENAIIPGRYRLVPVCNGVIAKMDALIVEIGVISKGFYAGVQTGP